MVAVLGVLALASACAGTRPAATTARESRQDAARARCAAEHANLRFAALPPESRRKIASELSIALALYWNQLGWVACGGAPATPLAELQASRRTVIVRHTGDLATLRAVGLTAEWDDDGLVVGAIELRRVADLAALPIVTALDAEPEVRPDRPHE